MKPIIAILATAFAVATPSLAVATTTVPAAISSRVVDARSNAPLAGVKVTAFPQGSTTAETSAMTDAKGQFTLAGLRGGDYRLLFERTGYPKSLAGGIGVKPHEHLVLISAFALQSDVKTGRALIVDPCASLVQPGQVADVYVICSGP